jgi:hypothetical protein
MELAVEWTWTGRRLAAAVTKKPASECGLTLTSQLSSLSSSEQSADRGRFFSRLTSRLNRFIVEFYYIKFDDKRVNVDVKRLKNRPQERERAQVK